MIKETEIFNLIRDLIYNRYLAFKDEIINNFSDVDKIHPLDSINDYTNQMMKYIERECLKARQSECLTIQYLINQIEEQINKGV